MILAYDAQIMVATVGTVAFEGLHIRPVDVQVMLSNGNPAFTVVGLPDKAVAESRERVRGALNSLGLSLPAKRITVNLSPADLLKEGSHFDLPIALGLLCAMDMLQPGQIENVIALGELGLDGRILAVSGILPAAMYALEQKQSIVCPADGYHEAAWVSQDLSVIAPQNLFELIGILKGERTAPKPEPLPPEGDALLPDFRDVKGQEKAKRALEIAAVGGHHVLMAGPPGAGKSMLAQRLSGILPKLTSREALDVAAIHSVSGLISKGKISRKRPFRNPHHTASVAALAGGGSRAKPGEISLAHHGVLFMDEFPEFPRQALEALRQPIETGEAMIARVQSHLVYPARFQLIAAMNPCRCGYLGDSARECKQAPECGFKYQSKISGPILDRIDIHIEVTEIAAQDLGLPAPRESSKDIAQRVLKARQIQARRFAQHGAKILCNAHAEGELLEKIAPLDTQCRQFLVKASDRLKLSARGYHRVLKVARTLADVAGQTDIAMPHLAEALDYRRMIYRAR